MFDAGVCVWEGGGRGDKQEQKQSSRLPLVNVPGKSLHHSAQVPDVLPQIHADGSHVPFAAPHQGAHAGSGGQPLGGEEAGSGGHVVLRGGERKEVQGQG